MKFYAVKIGRQPGVYPTWEACKVQVEGFPGARYKSFQTKKDAEGFAFGSLTTMPKPSKRASTKGALSKGASLIHIWVDGACLQHAADGMRFGWAYVILKGDQEVHRASGSDIPEDARQHRNVAGEIVAVLKALSWCQDQGITRATVYYDYQGLASWATGSWRTKTPFTQAYADTVRASGITLNWEKVRAHTGEPYNELVDQLARAAAQASPPPS